MEMERNLAAVVVLERVIFYNNIKLLYWISFIPEKFNIYVPEQSSKCKSNLFVTNPEETINSFNIHLRISNIFLSHVFRSFHNISIFQYKNNKLL